MFRQFFKITLRNLWQNKGYSFLNIAGLSVGMSVAILIGLWMNDELSYDKFNEKYDRIYKVFMTDYYDGGAKSMTYPSVPLPLAQTLRNDFPEIKYAVEMDWGWQHSLVVGDKRFFKHGIQTDNDFLKIFSFPLLKGDIETALKDPQSIVLSESMSEAIFGTDDPMGKTIRVDDRVDVTVTGIVQDPPDNSSLEFNFLLPFGGWESWASWVKEARSNWGNNSFQLFIELEEGASEAALAAKVKGLIKSNNEKSKADVVIHPMKKWRLYAEWKDGKAETGFIVYVRLFGIIGLFVLLIACINFMNLSTARSEKRAKEVGIRKTVGSGRWQLISQFLSEAILMSVLAFIISIALVALALPWFNELTFKEMEMPLANPTFLALATGFVLITGILAGSYPAFFLSSFKPIGVLKGVASKLGGNRFRQLLVVSQFTVSVALIIATIVIWQQINHVRERPTGYDSNRLAMVFSSQDLIDNYEIVKSEMLGSGAVESVTRASSPITAIYSNMKNISWPGKDPDDEVLFATVATSWDYTKTLGIKMLEGRDFSEAMKTDTTAVIFNKAAIDRMGLENPIGQRVKWEENDLTIIGVMDDVIMSSPSEPVQPSMLVCVPSWIDQIMFRLSPDIGTEEALARLEPIFERHNPSYPFEYQFADEQYAKKFAHIKMIGTIALLFGGLAIFISCLGLFGLAAYMAERRVKEIGIRKVLGATVFNLWGMLSKDFLLLVIISSVLAAPLAAWFLSDWLERYEYRITLNWWVFVVAIVLAMVVTIFTVSFQSIRGSAGQSGEEFKK